MIMAIIKKMWELINIAMLSFTLFCALDSPNKADKDALLNAIQVNFPHVGQILLCLKSRYHPHYLGQIPAGIGDLCHVHVHIYMCIYTVYIYM